MLPVDPQLRKVGDQSDLLILWVAKIDYPVTGDKDLLVLADCYPFIRPADFLARYGG